MSVLAAASTLSEILSKVMGNAAVRDKFNIHNTYSNVGDKIHYTDPFDLKKTTEIDLGDDCAAIPDGNGGFLLFASEGIIPSFLNAHPWFAGYSAVMVNISDICAMGGLPLAITDVLWIENEEDGKEIWAGMKAASEAYGVPIVGGHTCMRSAEKHLAVSVLGKANRLLTSHHANPGDALLMTVDLDGNYYQDYPFWNASTTSTPEKLKSNLRLMYEIAERALSITAKDISMGGIIGTLAMLLHTSQVGVKLNLEDIPCPENIPLEKWLISFPSFGYLIAAQKENVSEIISLFKINNLTCVAIGEILADRDFQVQYHQETIKIN